MHVLFRCLPRRNLMILRELTSTDAMSSRQGSQSLAYEKEARSS